MRLSYLDRSGQERQKQRHPSGVLRSYGFRVSNGFHYGSQLKEPTVPIGLAVVLPLLGLAVAMLSVLLITLWLRWRAERLTMQIQLISRHNDKQDRIAAIREQVDQLTCHRDQP
ncbi:MAG: hypothetical protein ACREP9_17520 [Candidatus Dormibacteraceae bacterium]